MTKNIVFLPGDGVGPEVAAASLMVLDAAKQKFDLDVTVVEQPFGGAAIDKHGHPLPDETLAACKSADAIFLGAIGGPKWDKAEIRPEQGLLSLRKKLDVFANLRPLKVLPGLESFSPLRSDLVKGADFIIVRELTGGVYFGKRKEGDVLATDETAYSSVEVERVARIAFEIAQQRNKRLTSVDKANVLATSRLWRNVVESLHKSEFSDIELHHQLVDSMAMKLITNPADFDVILTENMFGDILSDEASVVAGSIGLSPSASLGGPGPGLYEPIHGSAPDIAGQGKANPIGAVLSIAMMLRHSLSFDAAADVVESAVEHALASGLRTFDLGGKASCTEAATEICHAMGSA